MKIRTFKMFFYRLNPAYEFDTFYFTGEKNKIWQKPDFLPGHIISKTVQSERGIEQFVVGRSKVETFCLQESK